MRHPRWMEAGASVLVLALAVSLAVAEVEPVPTWFYVCVWYPTLALLDALNASRPSLLADPRRAAWLFGWSTVIWLLFEAANFRLQNWYYVFLPPDRVQRWTGTLLSFATVMPAIVLAAQTLESWSVGASWRARPMQIRRGDLRWCMLAGLGFLVLALGWPQLFFPLIWGGGLLLLDPLVYRARRPDSLLGDLERGEWGRIGRLALGGLGIGVLWEAYNHLARAKWIYTVPWLEETKLFEMPPYGFLGFPVFALSAWAMYHALAIWGVAVGVERSSAPTERPRAGRVAVASLGATVFAVATLLGMERYTISSVLPRRAQLETLTPEARRLVYLRGMGTTNARRLSRVGIGSVRELAAADPPALARALKAIADTTPARLANCPCRRPTAPEIRVWVRAARR